MTTRTRFAALPLGLRKLFTLKKPIESQPRLINLNGRGNVVQRLGGANSWRDLYHLLLTISWPGFFLFTLVLYLAGNALFGLGYLLGGDCITNARPGSFADDFFFSVETMATLGYGVFAPKTFYAHFLVTVESWAGILGVAMITGLTFAKFARPTARVLFSNVAVITIRDGKQTFMFRAANQRRNQILEAQMRATLVRVKKTSEGEFMRRFYDLKLVRERTSIFALTWTLMHVIDEQSPLYAMDAETLNEAEAEVVLVLSGTDETVAQVIHARHSYIASEIHWNMCFVDILTRSPEGKTSIDYSHFHEIEPATAGRIE
jgi:inward rectifier potassium channel